MAYYSYLTIMELRLHHRQDKSCSKKHTNSFFNQLPKASPDCNKKECSAAFLTFSIKVQHAEPNILNKHVNMN